jgi:hypothetical protein
VSFTQINWLFAYYLKGITIYFKFVAMSLVPIFGLLLIFFYW